MPLCNHAIAAQVSGDSLSALVPRLSNLQSLDLFQSYDFDDAQLAKCLDFLGSVTFLDLRGTVVSQDGIQQLARLQNLQKLCLAPKTEVRVEQHLCVVSHLTQLTSLAINNCRLVSFDLMASLAHLKLLRELDISNNGQVRVSALHLYTQHMHADLICCNRKETCLLCWCVAHSSACALFSHQAQHVSLRVGVLHQPSV